MRFPGLHSQPHHFNRSDDIFAKYVALEIDTVPKPDRSEIRMIPRIGNDLDVEPVPTQTGDREADAVHGDRSFMNDIRGEQRGKGHGEPTAVGLRANLVDGSHGIDMALHEMASQSGIGSQRPFKVHQGASPQTSQGRDPGGLGAHIRMHGPGRGVCRRQTHTIDGEAVARLQTVGQRGRDAQAKSGRRGFDLGDLAD